MCNQDVSHTCVCHQVHKVVINLDLFLFEYFFDEFDVLCTNTCLDIVILSSKCWAVIDVEGNRNVSCQRNILRGLRVSL